MQVNQYLCTENGVIHNMSTDRDRDELKALIIRANKKNGTPEESLRLIFRMIKNPAFTELKQKWFSIDNEAESLLEPDTKVELIKSQTYAIYHLIKQRKYKCELKAVHLTYDSAEYPFPANVLVQTDNAEEELWFDLLRPKELQRELEAVCSDFNNIYGGRLDFIDDTYNQICDELAEYNWKAISNVSSDFSVSYIKT